MSEPREKLKVETEEPETAEVGGQSEKRDWDTPALEDVSEEVMAQPYIRFT